MPDYFTLTELRGLPDMSNEARYPDARCEAVAAAIVGTIEREVGVSFVPREFHATLDGGTVNLLLPHLYVRSVVRVEIDAEVVTDRVIARDGLAFRVSGTSKIPWPAGYDNISVTYMAGYSATPPPDVKEWALKGTRAHLIATASDSSINDRMASQSGELGTTTFVMAGKDQPTGYPEVDAMILGWKKRLDVGGFA